jgi:hypothetical protein
MNSANRGRNLFSRRLCKAPRSTFPHSIRKFGRCSYCGDHVVTGNSSNERRTASVGGKRNNMKTISETQPAAAQPRPKTKIENTQ